MVQAMKAMIKTQEQDSADKIEAELKEITSQWNYILKKQVAPVRWSMKMWTRFNIAESQVHLFQRHFETDREVIRMFLNEYVDEALLTEIGWSQKDFDSKKAELFEEPIAHWLVEVGKWIDSCYDDQESRTNVSGKHADRIVKTGDQICRYDDMSKLIYKGSYQAQDMFHEFLNPILDGVKALHEDDYHKQYTLIRKVTIETGKSKKHDDNLEFHSFLCEWAFMVTRVRYFELIPSWELQRIADDTDAFWGNVLEFRGKLVDHKDRRGDKSLYTQEKVSEFEAKKNAISEFLRIWADPDRVHQLYDKDEDLFRQELRVETQKHIDSATEIYNWHYQMVMGEL